MWNSIIKNCLNIEQFEGGKETLSDGSKLGFSMEAILLPKAVLQNFQNTKYMSSKGAPGRNQESIIFNGPGSLTGIIYGKPKQQVGPNI